MAYAETSELQRILKITSPSDEQSVWLDRVLEMAAAEIDAEIDLEDGSVLSAAHQEIAATVNLMRAEDLWHHMVSSTGATLGVDFAETSPTRYSWRRYADMLAPLKGQWGLA